MKSSTTKFRRTPNSLLTDWILFVVILCFCISGSSAWTSRRGAQTVHNRLLKEHQNPFDFCSFQRRTLGLAALPEGYQDFGEKVIREAGASMGITNNDDLDVEWKGGRIIVTVQGNVYVSTPQDDENDAETDETEISQQLTTKESGVDVALLAKAINVALDDDGVGLAIAEAHEIEVTTPGASNELSGVMYESYKGFDVICQQQDPKTKKTKRIEGRLVERNDEFTIINIKGRMKKMKNGTVLSVTLPKAKKEKGSR